MHQGFNCGLGLYLKNPNDFTYTEIKEAKGTKDYFKADTPLHPSAFFSNTNPTPQYP